MAFFWCPPRDAPHTPHRTHTSPSRSALVAPRARWCASVGGGRSVVQQAATRGAGRFASHHAVPLLLHTTHAVHRPAVGGQAPSLHTVRRAVPAGAAAPGTTTTEADPPRARRPRRAAAREVASVDATTSGGASLARPRGACSTPCVPPSATTNASQTSRSEPLDALSLAQREASVTPRTPARPPSAPGPRARLAPPPKSQLPRFGIGGGDS